MAWRGGALYNYAPNSISYIDPLGLAVEDPFNYLDEALRKQGLQNGDTIPNGLKQKWNDSVTGNTYEVRIHPADPVHGKTGNIFRVARKQPGLDAKGQGKGTEYLDKNGHWHHESTLKPGKGSLPNPKYNPTAAADTHIEIPGCRKVGG